MDPEPEPDPVEVPTGAGAVPAAEAIGLIAGELGDAAPEAKLPGLVPDGEAGAPEADEATEEGAEPPALGDEEVELPEEGAPAAPPPNSQPEPNVVYGPAPAFWTSSPGLG